ncbi:hypothetical protein [Salidesulfovibrio brasiliensis]|uniref:hypothetical protein n=1 Tax=Salidesulfovibrio brasiliensis TaxID=221711 RepID=UPI0006D1881B|nr:hypothetical protein [Salidesulfovibrio brasiliensis]
MSPDLVQEVRVSLARIEERVMVVQEDIREINETRRCHTNNERIKHLERIVWGTVACVVSIGIRLLYQFFQS